jgi:hypothetical protein
MGTMRSAIVVGNVRFAEANAVLKSKGLCGWVSCTYGDLQLDGLRVRRHGDGTHSLGFPTHVDGVGIERAYYRPLDQSSRDAIESQVLGELRRRGRLT